MSRILSAAIGSAGGPTRIRGGNSFMRFVTRRSMAAAVGVLVAGGVFAVVRPADAEPTAPEPTAPESSVRLAQETEAAGAAGLLVGLKRGVAAEGPLKRLERSTGVDVVDHEVAEELDVITFDVADGDQAAAMAALRNDSGVAYVEPNYIRRAFDVRPDDPEFARQWALPTMRVPTAWDSTSGSSAVTIAVVDTGVNAIPNLAGALVPGYDYVGKDSNPTDPRTLSHGTIVAETIAGGGNDGITTAGVCWTCKIMPIRVLGADGRGTDANVALGIRLAADRGADIINLSLGGPRASTTLRKAVEYARGKGALVVAAAGNDGTSKRQYPAAIAGVLAVAASTVDDLPDWYSNYGADWVDVAAPGFVRKQVVGRKLIDIEGTSFSAPRVAGVAALGLARSPASTARRLTDAITRTAVPVGDYVAHGRVDAAAALNALPATVTSTLSTRIANPAPRSAVGGSVSIRVVADSRIVSIEGGPDYEFLGRDGAAPFRLTWPTGTLTAHRTVSLIATDAAGAKSTVTLPLTIDNAAPRITGTTPKAGVKLRGTITVTASGVSDTGSGIRQASLYADGRLVGTDRTAPYSVRYNTGKFNKTVKLQWKVWDRAGNSVTYDRAFFADNAAPSVSISKGPKNGAKVKGTVKLTADASDKYGIARVELLVNGKKVATDSASPYTFPVNTAKYGKTIKIQVRAYDVTGNVKYDRARTWKK